MAAVATGERVEARLASEHAAPALAELVGGCKLRSVVVGVSKDPNAKITILLVEPQLARVVLVVKVPTTDRAARVVKAEGRALRELAERAPHLGATVPRKICTVMFHGRPGLVMTPVAGRPMTSLYAQRGHTADPRRVAADFSAAARWLADLQGATAASRAPLDMDGGSAARIRERFGDEPEIGRDLERLAAIHDRLARNEVPRTFVHGDFWFGNLLLLDAAVGGVVDWEAGEGLGEPVRDLIRFALTYALFLDRSTRAGRRVRGHRRLRAGPWGAGVDYALDGSGWFPEIARQFLQTGLSRLGARPECWRDAALAGIAEVAALADDPEFARANLELFRRLAGRELPRHARSEPTVMSR